MNALPPYTPKQPSSIQSLFNSIAKQYDFGNALLSFQIHRLWNKMLIKEALWAHEPKTYLDLCCGTGDIAFSYLKKQKKPTTGYMLDFSPGMLALAKEKEVRTKLNQHTLHYIQADAQQIPLPKKSVEVVTLAYGIRNVQNPYLCAQEAFRVLCPRGCFAILELTRPNNCFLRWGHSFYLKYLLPFMAGWITSNKEAYHYLCDSIHHFMAPEEVVDMLEKTGFSHVQSRPLTGGIATLFICKSRQP